jgi:FixJ family two-component response regulator
MTERLMDIKERLVFIVDDDEEVRISTRVLLEVSGYIVQDFSRAEELLASANVRRAGCIVSDYNLPGMSGLELIETLRAHGINTPTIIVSSNGKHLVAQAVKAGVTAVLRKPMAAEALTQWLEQIFAESR